jgi:hypothetical protein
MQNVLDAFNFHVQIVQHSKNIPVDFLELLMWFCW